LCSEEGCVTYTGGLLPLEILDIGLYWLQTLDHFAVTVSPNTIMHSDTGSTIIYVQAKDSLDQDIMNYDGFIQISASPGGYGDLGSTAPPDGSEEGASNNKHTILGISPTAKPPVTKPQNKSITIFGMQPTGRTVSTEDGPIQIEYW